ncbi:MAG: helicase-related protein [Betaproteobacteria bacterium]
MAETMSSSSEARGLRSYPWLLSYRTSSTTIDGRPVDILHDFYVPALRLAVRYDRVAGYFRSSSLAAASQGFSAFVGRQGKMRLIVGADLEPDDVRAILAGDSQRLAARLAGELEQPASWPEGVRNGVTLLAWMVAHGYLEVRVAFRVHKDTGKPLPFDSMDDGYVHEKWFVLHDEFGNRLYGTGTLNESRTALVLNAENIDVHCDWWGEVDRKRVEQAAAAFENLWEGRVPHIPVMTLPEAVRQRLVRIADEAGRPVEIDGTTAAPKVVEPPSAMERLRFAILRDAPRMPGGRFVGMETAPVAPWPHQAVVVRRLIETWPYSYLLCDEVGLGKTIEAGLAFRSLYLAGLAKRILVAAPPDLTRQWHRQMASKLLLAFGRVLTGPETRHEYIWPIQVERTATSIYEPDLVIMSAGLLAREERAKALAGARPFDIALVDEAHAARRRNPSRGSEAAPDFGNLYRSIRDRLRPKARSLWLATATPMQIHPVEVSDLLALTNRVGAFQFDPTLTEQYYDILGKLVHNEELLQHEWDFLRRAVRAVEKQDPLLWRFLEDSVIDGRIRVAVRQWLEHGQVPRRGDRELVSRLLFSAAPLSRVMLRHTRRLLEIYRDNGQLRENLAQRHLLPIPRIVFTPLEKTAYDQLEEYCSGLARRIRENADSRAHHAIGFLLSFMRLRFASSLYAIYRTLERRLQKVEATLRHELALQAEQTGVEAPSLESLVFDGDEEDDTVAVESLLKDRSQADLEWERDRLREMIEAIGDLAGPSSKMQVLLDALDRRRDPHTGRIQQTVVFTRFYDTLTDIVTRLRYVNPAMLIGTYSGRGGEYFDPETRRMKSVDREEVRERFLRGEIDVLVCTDAAAEGLNLQTADLLVNFDLGWNPMKVEQRIGRIDRIGQKHKDIYVLNLCYANSAEEIVYGRLLSRLAEANMIVGTQQLSLLPVEPEDFRQLAEGTLTPEQLEARARERIEHQRKHSESMDMPPRALYETYMRMEQSGRQQDPPVNLPAIWDTLSASKYLRALGCTVLPEPKGPVLRLFGINGVPDGTVLTTSREVYEEGLGEIEGRIHFASYGDPFFEAILAQVEKFELPGCVRRISVPVPGMEGLEMVGYAVACIGPGGVREARLVRAWKDLEGLQLAEDALLTEDEVEPLRHELFRIAREEFQQYPAAGRIERENVRAAHAQEMLDLLVIRDLLEIKARPAGEGALFWPVLREVAALFEDRNQILISGLQADDLRLIARDVPFDCPIPHVGDRIHLQAPRILGRVAVDAACRLAYSLKVGKQDLTLETMLARLRREVEAKRRELMSYQLTA